MTNQYDAIIIGTGQAGPSLAARLAGEGQTVAIIERAQVGGSCVNFGCIPTKALVASARAAHMARRAADFGITIDGDIRVDMKRVKERMRNISESSSRGVAAWLDGLEHVTLLRGHARLETKTTVKVGDELLQAERIYLNVGTRARRPNIPGVDDVEFLTSTGLLALNAVPDHLVIVGGSYIGLELGQIYRRFGSEVTIVEMAPRLLMREDADVGAEIQAILEREGVQFRLGAECVSLARQGTGVAVGVTCDDGAPAVIGSHVLLAVGRLPNTDDLGLDLVGVDVDERGYVLVDDQLRTSVDGILALGDCNGRGGFTHTSYNDYEIAAANLLDDDPRRVSDRIPCHGLFIDPPLGRIGMSEDEARKSGRRVLIGKRPMTRVARAKEYSETQGFIKILVDADSQEILGAAILGLSGDEVVHGLLDVMYAKRPYQAIARAVHIHPTVSELIPTVLQELRPLAPEG